MLLKNFWLHFIEPSNPAKRRWRAALVIALIVVIGLADFLVGFEFSILVFYFLPVSLAVAGLHWRAGVAAAVISVATWLLGDFAAGVHFQQPLVPYWNALIALSMYLVLVWLLATLLSLHREMEERVRQRTVALTDVITERERLEKEMLEISERERRAVGRDLHDGLCQHLTGTALAGQVLADRLSARGIPEAGDALKVVELVEEAIDHTRAVAKGLLLAEIEEDGLLTALQELAMVTTEGDGVKCTFVFDPELFIEEESGTVTHLYRIAQECVRNALRHGNAKTIAITLKNEGDGLNLTVSDDGVGMPELKTRREGMGLRIMAHRAAMIGARFSVETRRPQGTVISCSLPNRP